MNHVFNIIIVVTAFLIYKLWIYTRHQTSTAICWDGPSPQPRCSQRCRHGYFHLQGMTECHVWLTCDQVQDIQLDKLIGRGAVKLVNLAYWNGHPVAVSRLAIDMYRDDFHHGRDMMMGFQQSPLVTQFVGQCNDTVVTEYHQHGSADNISKLFIHKQWQHLDSLSRRFDLCINYLQILHYLHNSPLGTRVMCDTNDLEKTLSQILITDDFNLVVNDLDALPQVHHGNNTMVKCGHRELFGDFVAPEQLWPYEEKKFNDSEMPPYDEKVDIWRIPNVCDFFLADVEGASVLKLHLFKIHKLCKSEPASQRPSAEDVLLEYNKLFKELNLHLS